MKLRESFQWMRHFELTNPKGKWVRFKGKALYPTISGNQRKYIDEELLRYAATLVGKPITVNHDMNHIVGNVEWAQYEDGAIEYLAQIDSRKYPEYADKIRDMFNLSSSEYIGKWGREPIYGVSVEANYLYHDEDCSSGLCTVEPHGIIFSALSLVEDPETPGVKDTTIELAEMKERSLNEAQAVNLLLHDMVTWHGMPESLYESYNTQVVNKIKEKTKLTKTKKKKEVKTTAAVSHEKVITHLPETSDPRAQFLMEQEETPADTGAHDCAEEEHWDEEQQKCVPNETATEQEEPCPEGEHRNEEGECVPDEVTEQEEPCPEGEVRNPETGECEPKATEQIECPEGEHKDDMGNCVPDKPPAASVPEFPEEVAAPVLEPKTPPPETSSTAETVSLRFGEPFADYADHADCVAKNQDKEDPDAYCAAIKRQTEERQHLLKKLDELHKEIRGLKKKQDTKALEQLHKEAELKETIKSLKETLSKLGFNFESIRRNVSANRRQRNSDIKVVKEQFSKVASWQRSRAALDKRQCTSIGELKISRKLMEQNLQKSVKQLKAIDLLAEKKYQVLGGVLKQAVNVLSSLNETLTSKASTAQIKEVHADFHTKLNEVAKQFKDVGNAYENLKKLEQRFQDYKKTQQNTVKETLSRDKNLKSVEERLQGEIDTLKTHVKPNFKANQKPPDQPDGDVVTETYQ